MAKIPVYNCFHPVLKKKTEAVSEIDDNLKKLVDDMFETMYYADGIGLAANQVGVSKSLLIVDTSASLKERQIPYIMINPEITAFSDDEIEMQEGCLSVPQFYDNVVRPFNIQVKYFDLNMKEYNIEADELLSRVIQHEFDHLNGILFYERLSSLRRTLAGSKLKKIQKGKIIPDYEMIGADGKMLE
jgi:peptide deformylase